MKYLYDARFKFNPQVASIYYPKLNRMFNKFESVIKF